MRRLSLPERNGRITKGGFGHIGRRAANAGSKVHPNPAATS